MIRYENLKLGDKMNYWQFKFKKDFWKDFETLELGDTFTTTITDKEKNKLNNRKGDIVFWYPSKSNKMVDGIYFVTKIISNVMEDDNYLNGYSIEMIIIELYKDNPFSLSDNNFKHIEENTKKGNFFQFNRYLFTKEDNGKKLYSLLRKSSNKSSIIVDNINDDNLERIKKIKEKNINSGTMFNPFLDMKLMKNEVKHLAFIANLINPNGTHYQGDKFLKLFIKRLSECKEQQDNKFLKNIINSKNNEDIVVETERYLDGNKGRIDIWIESNDYIIAIEGKTETKDSKEQLSKYDKYLQKQIKPYLLIYLTKTGEKPINSSPNNLQLMSFQEGIKDFIDYSLEEKIPKKITTTLIEYRNSLITYLYGLKFDWRYSLDIINEITKNKRHYKQYQIINNLYYRDMKKYKFTVVEDIAKNFAYAKAYIERLFFMDLISNMTDEDEIDLLNNSNVLLSNFTIEIAKDIFTIATARVERINHLGQITFTVMTKDKLFKIDNDYFGLKLNAISKDDVNSKDYIKVESSIFKSDNISKLLDKKYRNKLIKKVLE